MKKIENLRLFLFSLFLMFESNLEVPNTKDLKSNLFRRFSDFPVAWKLKKCAGRMNDIVKIKRGIGI